MMNLTPKHSTEVLAAIVSLAPCRSCKAGVAQGSPRRRAVVLMAALALIAFTLVLGVHPAVAQTPVVEATNANEEAVLQVNDDGGLLGLGVFETGVVPAKGAGTRLMWHPAKAAFRAGRVGVFSNGTEWDDANVGEYSVAFGLNTEAGGRASTAMGRATTASGNFSAAMGVLTTASGAGATAMGASTEASGNTSTAMGSGTEASGATSTAMGVSTTAGGDFSTAMGSQTRASGSVSMAMGLLTAADGNFSLAAGRRAIVRADDHGTFAWGDSENDDFISTGPDQFLIRAAGGVGLGTNAPLGQLHVAKALNGSATLANHVALIENTSGSTSNGPDVLALKTSATSPNSATNFVTFFDGTDEAIGAIEGNGSGGVVYKTSGGDFAEMLPRLNVEEAIAPGDVVGVVGGRITKATAGAEQVLVVTDRPAVLGNAHLDAAASSPVAFVGQVPVQVRGSVEIGDWIVPSGRGDGMAVAIAPEAMTLRDHAQVIGRAWESATGGDVTTVNVAVGLDRVGTLVEQLQRQQRQIEALHRRQDEHAARFQAQLNALRAAGRQ